MAYSDFDLREVRERFGFTLREDLDLCAATPGVEVSRELREFLRVWSPAAMAMNTAKARSEMIIAPILMEAVRLSGVVVHSELDGVMHNGVGAQPGIHRCLIIGLSPHGSL